MVTFRSHSSAANSLSALHLQNILGHLAWFALLTRPVFSCLYTAYDVARDGTSLPLVLPTESIAELLLFGMLLPWIGRDLTREWQRCIVASHASPSEKLLGDFARDAVRANALARLERDGMYADEEAERRRIGRACRLLICKAAFSTVIS